jgi:hypothetical protein
VAGGSGNVEYAKFKSCGTFRYPRFCVGEPLLDLASMPRIRSLPRAPTDTQSNITVPEARIFGAILLAGFCRLIIHITKAHQTHRMRPTPMDLRHARKMQQWLK